eukprot:3266929-Alexandrium_andersonii.AAC.1
MSPDWPARVGRTRAWGSPPIPRTSRTWRARSDRQHSFVVPRLLFLDLIPAGTRRGVAEDFGGPCRIGETFGRVLGV